MFKCNYKKISLYDNNDSSTSEEIYSEELYSDELHSADEVNIIYDIKNTNTKNKKIKIKYNYTHYTNYAFYKKLSK
jgi:hypothetical protein